MNLVSNALGAVLKGSERWLKLSIEQRPGAVALRVVDSGPPLDSRVAEHLMTPFFTTKDPGEGTGLGLSLSKSLAERMSGNLHLVRTAKNTTFELTLPCARPSEIGEA